MDAQQLHARRLLSHAAAAAAPSQGPAVQEQVQVGQVHARAASPFSSLNATVITVLSLLLCGLVVVIAVHVIVRCAFRVTRRVCYGQEEPPGGAATSSSSSSSCQTDTRTKGGRARRALPPPVVYPPEVELAGCGAAECAICLTEFAHGDRVRALPHCNHGFHVRCIDRWLAARHTCPTCRRAPFAAKPSAPEAEEELQVQVDAGAGEHETR